MSPYLVLLGAQNLDVLTIEDLTGSMGTTLGFHLTHTVTTIQCGYEMQVISVAVS